MWYIRALRNVIWLQNDDKAALRKWKEDAKSAAQSETATGTGDKDPPDNP